MDSPARAGVSGVTGTSRPRRRTTSRRCGLETRRRLVPLVYDALLLLFHQMATYNQPVHRLPEKSFALPAEAIYA
jgi:hypothetical protein